MRKIPRISLFFSMSLLVGVFSLFSSFATPSQVCAAQWGSCATGARRACPANGVEIAECIDSVDIVGYVYDAVNMPPGTKVTMYIGQAGQSCSDVTCLLRHDDGSTTWDGSLKTIGISTIGCSSGACRVDGRDWIDVTFSLSKSGWSSTGCRAEMSARGGGGGWFQSLNESEMRGRMDITGLNTFSREVNVKFVCPGAPVPTNTPKSVPTNTPVAVPTPTKVPTPTPTSPPGTTPKPTPTPTTCPIPGQVVNVHVTCPNCAP